MRIDGIQLQEGSHITNLTVDSGTVFPSTPNAGELFYLNSNNGNEGLYVYNDSTWAPVAGSGAFPPGGTTGQLLRKLSATNGDTEWFTLTPSFTTADARNAVSAFGTGLTYDSSTGIFTFTPPTPVTQFTTADARASISVSGTGLSYNSSTGVLTITPQTLNGLLPVQTSNAGKFLNTDGTNASWSTIPSTTITGDVTGTVVPGVSSALTLATVATAATKGSASKTVTVVVNAKGLVTSVVDQDIAIAAAQVTSGTFADARIAATNVTQHQAVLSIAETQIPNGTLLARVADNETIAGTWTFTNSIVGNVATATTLATGRTIGMTGDVVWTSGTFNGSANVTGTSTLATVNSNVGTFGSTSSVPVVTVNAKGLVTAVTTATVNDSTKVLKSGDTLTGNLIGTAFRAAQGTPADDTATVGYAFGSDGDTGVFGPGFGPGFGVVALYGNGARLAQFSINGITLDYPVTATGGITGSITGASSLNVLKAGDTMSGVLDINVGAINSPGTLFVRNTGTNGTGIYMLGNGATTPSKWLRVLGGTFEIISHDYSRWLMRVFDSGNVSLSNILDVPQIITYSPDGLRLKPNGGTTGIATIFRNDGVNTYFLLTNNDASGDAWNSLRPFTMNGATGNITIPNLYSTSFNTNSVTASGNITANRYLAADGTNLAPSYSFSADGDTGINHTTDGEIQTIVNSVLTSSTTNSVHRQDTNLQIGTTGTSRRILGDFSSGAVNTRTLFQNLIANSPSAVGIIPSGTGVSSSIQVYNASTGVNSAFGALRSNATEVALLSNVDGSGTVLPLNFYVNNSLKMQFGVGGDWSVFTNDNKIGFPTGDVIVNIGAGATANRFALTDYIGDTTYTDYGLRVGRGNTGPNSTSVIIHRGTSNLQINAYDAGNIEFLTNNTQVGYFGPNGNLNLNYTLNINKQTSGGSALVITDTSVGGSGITLTGNGAVTPSKSIRAIAGNLEFINSAYSAVIATLADDGTFLPNAIRSSGNVVGRTIVSRPPNGGTEGGQFVLGYNGYPNVVDQQAGTWNIDVTSANDLRFFRVGTTGVTSTIMQLTETDGTVNLYGNGLVMQGPGDQYFEIGRRDGVASGPFIDFHSGATPVDFDARIQALGGNGAAGGGSLNYSAIAGHNFTGQIVGSGNIYAGSTVFATQFYTAQASTGNVSLQPGGASNTGFVAFNAANGVRQGYVGFATGSGTIDTGQVNYVTGTHAFSGTLINASATPAIFQSVATTGSGVAYRLKDGNNTSGIASLLYSDTANFYFLLTNNNDANGTFNALRPLTINKTTGYVTINGQVSLALDTNSIASAVGGSYNWTGTQGFIANKGSTATIASTSSYALQAQATDLGPAGMSFHRTGAYAINMGLNPDGTFAIGGWSDGNVNRMLLTATGAVSFPAAVNTGYYTGGVAGSTYGSIKVAGVNNGFTGVYLSDGGGTVVGMHGTGGDGGTWDPTTGWHFYWNRTQLSLGLGGSATSASYRVYSNGSHYIAGALYATGEVTAFSDARVKKNVETITGALEKVQEVRGVTYDRLEEDGRRHTGVIAQELEAVLPEAVYEEKDSGMKTVAYGNVVGLLIEAIKELNAKVDSLQAQLNAKAQ